MTRDAKIGLLLGLVFIFIIAFLLNGLPSLHENKKNNNELTTNMVSSQGDAPGLGAKERKAQEIVEQTQTVTPVGPINQTADNVQSSDTASPDIRYETLLPDSGSVVKNVEKSDGEIKQEPGVGGQTLAKDEGEPVKTAWPKTYVVKEGDSLALVAKRFYGSQEGNKSQNIDAIFEANRKLLKSPDEVYIGQKLIIPGLRLSSAERSPDSSTVQEKTRTLFADSTFEKVKSIGQKHLTTNPALAVKTKQGGEYVVKEGDSLWKIAQEQLGDGSRYSEISKFNTDILKDEDTLVVGMRLRLPGR